MCKFLSAALKLPYLYQKATEGSDMSEVDSVEAAIVNCFVAFIVKLNEAQLRPVILKLLKSASKVSENAGAFPVHKTLVFFKLANALLESLREFFVPSYSLYFEFQLSTFNKTIELLKTSPV